MYRLYSINVPWNISWITVWIGIPFEPWRQRQWHDIDRDGFCKRAFCPCATVVFIVCQQPTNSKVRALFWSTPIGVQRSAAQADLNQIRKPCTRTPLYHLASKVCDHMPIFVPTEHNWHGTCYDNSICKWSLVDFRNHKWMTIHQCEYPEIIWNVMQVNLSINLIPSPNWIKIIKINQDSQNQMMNRIDSESNDNCQYCNHHRITGVARWHWPARIWELSARSTPPDIGLLDHHVIVTSWQNGAVESVESHCLYENHEHHETSKRKVISGCWASSTFFFSCQTVKHRQTSSKRRLWVEASLPALMLGNASEQRRTNAEATQKQRRNMQSNLCSVRLDLGLSCFRGIHLLAQKVSRWAMVSNVLKTQYVDSKACFTKTKMSIFWTMFWTAHSTLAK